MQTPRVIATYSYDIGLFTVHVESPTSARVERAGVTLDRFTGEDAAKLAQDAALARAQA